MGIRNTRGREKGNQSEVKVAMYERVKLWPKTERIHMDVTDSTEPHDDGGENKRVLRCCYLWWSRGGGNVAVFCGLL